MQLASSLVPRPCVKVVLQATNRQGLGMRLVSTVYHIFLLYIVQPAMQRQVLFSSASIFSVTLSHGVHVRFTLQAQHPVLKHTLIPLHRVSAVVMFFLEASVLGYCVGRLSFLTVITKFMKHWMRAALYIV